MWCYRYLKRQWCRRVGRQKSISIGYGAVQALPGPMFSFSAYLGVMMHTGNSLLMGLLAVVAIFLPGFVGGSLTPFWHILVSHNKLAKQLRQSMPLWLAYWLRLCIALFSSLPLITI